MCILVLILSAFGTVRASGGGGGLPHGITLTATPYYPYIVSPSLYPYPDTAVAATSGLNITLPQLGATGVGTTPTYFLVYDGYSNDLLGAWPHQFHEWQSHLYIQEGTYSPWLAVDILTGASSTRTIPLNWSAPEAIATVNGTCSSTALQVAPSGSAIVAGIGCGTSNYVYESSAASALESWTEIGTPMGSELRLALDPDGYALASTISGGDAVATYLPFPSGTVVSTALSAAVQAAPVVVRTAAGSVLGVATLNPSSGVTFWEAPAGPSSFGAYAVTNLRQSNTSAIFNSIGSTHLGNPGGIPNQLAATVVGQSIEVVYTVLVNGTTEAAISTSATEGVGWNPAMEIPLSYGSIADPQLVGAQDGDVYASWLSTGGGNLTSIEQTVFAADGRILQSPSPIPGGTGTWPLQANEVVGLAVDEFERPLFIWANPATGANAIQETGAFLAPSAINLNLQGALGNLTGSDLTSGTLSRYQSGIQNLLSEVVANATQASTSTHLNAARNLTAAVYQNVSVTGFDYLGEIITSSQHGQQLVYKYSLAGGAVLTSAVETGVGYSPPATYGEIVQSLGFGSAATYMEVESDWMFAAEGVEATAASSPLTNISLPPNYNVLDTYGQPGYASTTVDGNESSAVVTPIVQNPTTIQMSISGSFPTYKYTISSGSTTCNSVNYPTRVDKYTDTPSTFNDTPNLNLVNYAMVSKTSFVSSFYLQNVSADTLIDWELTLTAAYTETDNWTTRSGCSTNSGQTNLGHSPTEGPETVSMLTGASLSTTLSTYLSVTEFGSSEVSLSWQNSMIADGASSLAPLGKTSGLTGFKAEAWANYTGLMLTTGDTYTAAVNTSSEPGGYVTTTQPSVSASEQTSSPAQATTSSCQFVYQTNTLTSWGLHVTGGNNSTASAAWWANGVGEGTLEYSETGTALNQSATAIDKTDSNGSTQYTVNVHGLPGAAFYNLEATTSTADGACLNLASAISASAFLGQGFSLQPVAYAYDSITQEGGGEGIHIYLSPDLYTQMEDSIVKFTNGSLEFGPTNLLGPNVTVPISSLTNLSCGGDCYVENITPSAANTTYVSQAALNFTWNHVIYSLSSSPTTFTYLLDSTGDGLTNAEKLAGWTVTYTDVHGATHNLEVTAAPSLYSTNGLVGDYVEKEYGLNPHTVDTSGSHMLDTWNLTFNLGASYPLDMPTTTLQVWNETGLYNPFATTVQYSPGLFESGASDNSSPSNCIQSIAPSPKGGPLSGDGSPEAATYLYSDAALWQLSGLITTESVGWVRGVLGTYDGVHTLTVWGKLSWGDDPLIASAPADGIADGARVNPMSVVGLHVIGLNATAYNLGTGAGYAVAFQPSNSTTRLPDYLNYSSQALVGNETIPSVINYTTVLPVPQTAQTVTLLLEIAYETSGDGLADIPINGTALGVNFTYDLVGGRFVQSFSSHGTFSDSPYGSFAVSLQTALMRGKAPTFIWSPTTNSSISHLPIGLRRYTGEQSFDLIVANASATITSDSIPLPWGGTYTLTLKPGLNNILIPREQFFESAIGEAILEGKAPSYNRSDPTPPLLGLSGVQTLISSFDGANPYVNLSAYWQNRAIAVGTQGNFSNEGGVSPSNVKSIEIVAVTSPPSNNSGGLPSDPSILNASNANAPTAAVQTVLMMNITSTSGLDVLAAGLLDNSSNGVNGSFVSVTNEVPFLGLESAVVDTLANSAVLSDGLCPAPQSSYPPPPSHSSGIWGDFVNAVCSVVQTVSGAILSLVSTVYTGLIEAETFVSHLAREAADVGGVLLARAAATLVSIGKEILAALEALLSYLASLIERLLSPLTDPVSSAMDRYTLNLASTIEHAYNDTQANRSIAADAAQFWAEIGSNLFLLVEALSLEIAIAVSIIEDFSLGIGFLISIVIGLVVVGVAEGVANDGGPNFLSDFVNIDPISAAAGNEWVTLLDPPPYLTELGQLLGVVTDSFAATTILTAWEDGEFAAFSDGVGLTLGVLSLVVGGVAASYSSPAGADASLVFDSSSVAVDAISLAQKINLLNTVTLALDGGAVAIDLNTLGVRL